VEEPSMGPGLFWKVYAFAGVVSRLNYEGCKKRM
jgi:hypothetical protein